MQAIVAWFYQLLLWLEDLWLAITFRTKLGCLLNAVPRAPVSHLSEELFKRQQVFRAELPATGDAADALHYRLMSSLRQGERNLKAQAQLMRCIEEMSSCVQKRRDIEDVAKIPFDSSNTNHMNGINEVLQLASKAGYSGDREALLNITGFSVDPARDFRGLGLLGLQNILYLVRNHPRRGQEMLELSQRKELCFPFVPASLHASLWALQMLRSGDIDAFLFENELPAVETHGCVYSYAFLEFLRFWRMWRPTDLREFNEAVEAFRPKLQEDLKKFMHGKAEAQNASFDVLAGDLDGESLCKRLYLWVEGEAPHQFGLVAKIQSSSIV